MTTVKYSFHDINFVWVEFVASDNKFHTVSKTPAL